jgi:hypothetical protein
MEKTGETVSVLADNFCTEKSRFYAGHGTPYRTCDAVKTITAVYLRRWIGRDLQGDWYRTGICPETGGGWAESGTLPLMEPSPAWFPADTRLSL